MTLLILIAMTHFCVANKEDPEWHQQLSKLSDSAKMLYNMVCEFHVSKPMRCIPPYYICNQNATVDYICEGVQPDRRSSDVGLMPRASLVVLRQHVSAFHLPSEKYQQMNTLCGRWND